MNNLLVHLLGSVFQALSVCYIINRFDSNIKIKRWILFFPFLTILILISGIYIPNQLRLIYFLTVLILACFLILGYRDKTCVIYGVMVIIISAISELITLLFFILMKFNTQELVNNDVLNMKVTILVSICSIIIVKLPFIKLYLKKIINYFFKSKKALNYLYICLTLLYLLILKNGWELLLKNNFYINFMLLVGIITLMTFTVLEDIKQKELLKVNKQTQEYLEKYEKIITEQGKTTHEFRNQLMVIKGYAEINSPKLLEYLETVVKDTLNTKSTYLISQLNNFPSGGIKGLIYYKLSSMENKNIKYELYTNKNVKKYINKIPEEDMYLITKVLGVLLDNAIEASSKSKDKKIFISLTCDKGIICFEISNTFIGKIEINKLGTGYSTKGKGRGYGIKLINDITEKKDIFDFKIEVEDKLFKSIFKIDTRKKRS